MNDQAQAILNGAVAQLEALSVSQQASIDADTADIQVQEAKLAADQADVATQTTNKENTDQITAALKNLLAVVPSPVSSFGG